MFLLLRRPETAVLFSTFWSVNCSYADAVVSVLHIPNCAETQMADPSCQHRTMV